MTPNNSDGFSEGDWEDPDELGWSEFDWEKYLRQQDEVVQKYISCYEQLGEASDRLDQVAELMGWDGDDEEDDDELDASAAESSDDSDELEPYTLQRNPVFIAATALYQLLNRSWEFQSLTSDKISKQLALRMQGSLLRGQHQSLLGIQSLDLGDYTMAISLFKRAMRELNVSLSQLNDEVFNDKGNLEAFRETMVSIVFDLREVLLRVIAECREEVSRHTSTGDDDASGDSRSKG